MTRTSHLRSDIVTYPISPDRDSDNLASSRRAFLKGGAAVAGVALASGVASEATAAPVNLRQQMSLVRRHENDHVDFIANALGAQARPKPTFQNLQRSNVNDFLTVALALENTGVGA